MIKSFGHSFFQIISSQGTKIITDPFGAMGFPMPEVWPHVVTVGREHGNHNNVGLAKGNEMVLRGIKEGGDDWNASNLTFRDVLIYNVPVHQRGVPGNLSLRGSGFVFEMDGLCIFHSGDVSEPYNEDLAPAHRTCGCPPPDHRGGLHHWPGRGQEGGRTVKTKDRRAHALLV